MVHFNLCSFNAILYKSLNEKILDQNHNENTFEIKHNAREHIFGKKIDTTIVTLDWAQEEDIMMVDTRKKILSK
jgi:hypothetical protein